jgi:hypothetical protein
MAGEAEVPKTAEAEETQQPGHDVREAKAGFGRTKKGDVTGAEWVRTSIYGIALLLVLISTMQLYFSIQSALGIWFEEDYVPVLQSLYFLMVASGGLYIVRGALKRA